MEDSSLSENLVFISPCAIPGHNEVEEGPDDSPRHLNSKEEEQEMSSDKIESADDSESSNLSKLSESPISVHVSHVLSHDGIHDKSVVTSSTNDKVVSVLCGHVSH